MNKANLTERIWLSFIALIVFLGLLIAFIYPLSIKGTLTEETYQIILQEQERILNPLSRNMFPDQFEQGFIERRNASRSVGHALIVNQAGRYQGDPIPEEVFQEMAENAYRQEREWDRYELTYNEATLFYVIRQIHFADNDAFLISYMWDTYRNQMVKHLWQRLLVILFIAGVVSLFPALWLARYLRRPLTVLGNRFEQIAKRNWKEPFKWEGEKEFEMLSNQFESMRQNLIRYDDAQKTFIQHASHELKTPIMIITSYAQSVKDGILPKEDMDETMDVILHEAKRMDKRIRDMIYYTKLGALKDDKKSRRQEPIRFGPLAEEIAERFRYQRDDVEITIAGDEVVLTGDREQLEILLDNLVQNAIRYASDRVSITALERDKNIILSVYNNGENIADHERRHLFTPFQKGSKGQFGLGLAIVKQIAELHDGDVTVTNEKDGVTFTVIFPNV